MAGNGGDDPGRTRNVSVGTNKIICVSKNDLSSPTPHALECRENISDIILFLDIPFCISNTDLSSGLVADGHRQ